MQPKDRPDSAPCGGCVRSSSPQYAPRKCSAEHFRGSVADRVMWPMTTMSTDDADFRHHRPHNHQSDESHSSRVSSDCQTGRGRGPTEEPGGSVFRSASIFALVLISA